MTAQRVQDVGRPMLGVSFPATVALLAPEIDFVDLCFVVADILTDVRMVGYLQKYVFIVNAFFTERRKQCRRENL